ncbi:MAG: hypothetical protein M5R36_26020 [Deltaproteobacteria bacterium]|nr:hypothetical protein [Deltaproteobacteria bacterium]
MEVRLIELDGETGSIQRMVPKLKAQKDFKGIDPKDLLPAELEQVQREHVVDWLISNPATDTGEKLPPGNGRPISTRDR